MENYVSNEHCFNYKKGKGDTEVTLTKDYFKLIHEVKFPSNMTESR